MGVLRNLREEAVMLSAGYPDTRGSTPLHLHHRVGSVNGSTASIGDAGLVRLQPPDQNPLTNARVV